MEPDVPDTDARRTAPEIIGYLNFSSGAPDPRFLGSINELFGLIAARREDKEPAWRSLGRARERSSGFRWPACRISPALLMY